MKWKAVCLQVTNPSLKLNRERKMHRSSTVYKQKQSKTNMSLVFDVRGQQGMDFFSGKSLILDYGLIFWSDVMASSSNILLKDLFLTNSQLFTSQDINWWTGVVWISCGLLWFFLSAVWTLILTAPIHCRGSTGEQILQICYNKEINPWMAWRWVHF